jgi:hypothetical protein
MTRRKDKKDEAERQRNAAAEAQAMRREHRRCLREQLRIKGMQDKILDLVDFADKTEYHSQLMVSDIREYSTEQEYPDIKTVHVIGGFVGELILTLNAINTYITSNPSTPDFKFTHDSMEKFLGDIFCDDYPTEIATLHISNPISDQKMEDVNLQTDIAAKKLMIAGIHQSFGFRLLMEMASTLMLSD